MVLTGALLIVISPALDQTAAQAHALLTSSSPADGTSVEQPPEEMLFAFTEPPDPELSIVQLFDSSGKRLETGKAEPVPGQPAQLRVPLGLLPPGSYTATWRVTSPSDGHTTAGAVTFGVAVPAVAGMTDHAPADARVPGPTLASVAGRWLFHVGVVLMIGAGAVGVVVVSNARALPRSLLAAAWLVSAVGMLFTIADQRAAAHTTLGNLLTSSTGHKLTTQAGAIALAGLAVVRAWHRPSRASLAAVGIGASAAMFGRALAGHANASSVRWFAVGTQWVHLVSVGVWVGGLFWLLVAIRRRDPGRGRGLTRRFSSLAVWAVAAVAVSGSLRALDEVGAWTRLVDTSFGVTLLTKFALFAGLVAVAARSHFRHVARASAGELTHLRRAVRGEVVLAAGVLGAAALLAGLPPPDSVAAASKESATLTGESGPADEVPGKAGSARAGSCGQGTPDSTYAVAVDSDPEPARAEGTTFRLRVRQDDKPVRGAKVCLKLDMPDMPHPGVSAVATEVSPGTYDARLRFSMTGGWTGSVTIAESGGRVVSVPMGLEVI